MAKSLQGKLTREAKKKNNSKMAVRGRSFIVAYENSILKRVKRPEA